MFRMDDRSGDGTGSFEVKIRTKTENFTNTIIARFRESRYLVRESEGFRTPGFSSTFTLRTFY